MLTESQFVAIENLVQGIPGLNPDRAIALFAPAECGPAGLHLLAEQAGERIGEAEGAIQPLRKRLAAQLGGTPCRLEILRPGWLTCGPDRNESRQQAIRKLTVRHTARKSQRSLRIGDNAENIPEEFFDLFSSWGYQSRLRTPADIETPENISIGSWVSLGRRGKILLMDDFTSLPGFIRQHYPDQAVNTNAATFSRRRPSLHIGDGSSLGDGFFIAATCRIEIGKHVVTSQDLFLTDCAHVYDDPSLPIILQGNSDGHPLIIEDGCWIGIRVSIIKGVRIGRHAVVGAGSVVNADVPPYAIVAGAPARIIGYQDPAAIGTVRRPGATGPSAAIQSVRFCFESAAGHPLSESDNLHDLGLMNAEMRAMLAHQLFEDFRLPPEKLHIILTDHSTPQQIGLAIHRYLMEQLP